MCKNHAIDNAQSGKRVTTMWSKARSRGEASRHIPLPQGGKRANGVGQWGGHRQIGRNKSAISSRYLPNFHILTTAL